MFSLLVALLHQSLSITNRVLHVFYPNLLNRTCDEKQAETVYLKQIGLRQDSLESVSPLI
jgi:hypothetical protein